jgi:hypothetical protein
MTTEMEYLLLVANIAAYVAILIGSLTGRKWTPSGISLAQAFPILEKALARAFPDMGAGYTWEEAIAMIKSSKPRVLEVDWGDLDKTMKLYEAFRYGGIDYGNADPRTVLMLAQKLQRRRKNAG